MSAAAPAAHLVRQGVAVLEASRRVPGERLAVTVTAVAVALLPLAVPEGPANMAPNVAFIVVAVVACLLWGAAAGVPWRFPYVIPVALILTGGALAGVVGSVPQGGLVALVQDVVLIVWCWAVVNISRSAANLRLLLATWAYSAVAWAVVAFVGIITGSPLLTGEIERQGTRLQLTLNDPSYTANYFFISLMIVWATGRPTHRLARYAAYGLFLGAIAYTGSNSGVVALVVGTTVAGVLAVYRRLGVAPAVAAAAVLVVAAGVLATTVSLSSIQASAAGSRYAFIRQGLGRSPDSAGQRQSLLQESVGLYQRGNPLGEGPVSTKPRLEREQAPLIKEAHDDYLAALIERGPIGLIGVLLLVCSLALRGLFATRERLAAGFAATVPRPNALVGAVAGTLVAGTVYELLHVRHVWALFAVVAALSVWGRGRE
jgi:O-antigen ligase